MAGQSSGMKTMYVHDRITDAPTDIEVGEHVEVVRGNGPREGESIGYATISSVDPLAFRFEVWPMGFGHEVGTDSGNGAVSGSFGG